MKIVRKLNSIKNPENDQLIRDLLVDHCKTWGIKNISISDTEIAFSKSGNEFKIAFTPYVYISKGKYTLIYKQEKKYLKYEYKFSKFIITQIILIICALFLLVIIGIDLVFLKFILIMLPLAVIIGICTIILANRIMFNNLLNSIIDSITEHNNKQAYL